MSKFPFGNEQLLDFIMTAPWGLALYAGNGEILFCNHNAQNVLGISPEKNHGPTLTNHHLQLIDSNGSVLSTSRDPIAMAIEFFDCEPWTAGGATRCDRKRYLDFIVYDPSR